MGQREPLPSSAERSAFHPVALYLVSLAAMIGLYSLYAKFLVPIIEGPTQQVQRRIASSDIKLPSLAFDKTELTRLLPADAWENSGCKTLLTSQGTILFKDFERVQGGYLEVFPFTLVTSSKSGTDSVSSKPPTFLRCLRGARLKFDKPISEAFTGQARMESAQLVGQVNIFRPPSSANGDDGLSISTSNVQIEKQQIFTIEDVSFAVGLNRGSGKNLLIELAHHTDANEITGDFSSIRGIKRIELAYLNELRLESRRSQQLNQRESSASPSSAPDRADLPITNLDSPLSIECGGPFVFDLESSTATFNEQVVIRMENEFRDKITADSLTVYFEESQSGETTGIAPTNRPSDLKLQKLVARGSPAVMFSAEREAKISADQFTYDSIQRYFVAESEPSGNQTMIVSPDYHVVAGRITYQMAQPGGLGIIEASGPGKLLRIAGENQKELFVQWRDQLSVQPNGRQYQIQLSGDAKVRIDLQTAIQSDKIAFWLNESEVITTGDDGKFATAKKYQPVKLIAETNVVIKSPRLDGSTGRLTATWSNDGTTPQTGLVRPAGSAQMLASNGKVTVHRPRYLAQEAPFHVNHKQGSLDGRNMQPISRSPGQMRPTQVATASFDQEVSPRQQKFSFQGDEVVAKLISKADQTEIEDLTLTGNVSITEITAKPSARGASSDDESNQPLHIKGDLLRCLPQSQDQMRILVAGTSERAASVIAKNLDLRGQNIHLDQAANKLWVEGNGKIRLKPKPQTIPTGLSDQNPLPAAKLNQDVNISWRGGMIFDGAKLYFEDRVEMESHGRNKEGNPIVVRSTSAGLNLTFNRSIQFQDLQNDAPSGDLDIRELVIVDRLPKNQRVFKLAKTSLGEPENSEPIAPAAITNQTFDLKGELIEQQQFFMTQATLNSVTGAVQSKGPGVIMHYSKGKNPLLSGETAKENAAPSANFAFPTGSPDGLTFIRLNFDGSANANLNQNEMTIRGNVRTLYAPVDSIQVVYDPDQSERLPRESVKITCEQLKIAQWTPRNSSEANNELIATGNTHINSSNFEATADRVSYNRSTDILVVEGTPRSDAHLWFKQTPNSPQRDHLVAGKILYRLADQWTDVQGVKNVNINRK